MSKHTDPNPAWMPPLTLAQAKKLTRGTTLYHRTQRNAGGDAMRFRLASSVKTWRTMPDRVQFTVRYGIQRDTETVTERDLLRGDLSPYDGLSDPNAPEVEEHDQYAEEAANGQL
jgi:hypothetical protein